MYERHGFIGLIAGLALACGAAPAIAGRAASRPSVPSRGGPLTHIATAAPVGRRAARRARGRALAARAASA